MSLSLSFQISLEHLNVLELCIYRQFSRAILLMFRGNEHKAQVTLCLLRMYNFFSNSEAAKERLKKMTVIIAISSFHSHQLISALQFCVFRLLAVDCRSTHNNSNARLRFYFVGVVFLLFLFLSPLLLLLLCFTQPLPHFQLCG